MTLDLDTILQHYQICSLWSSTDNSDDAGGDPLDDNYSVSDMAPQTVTKMRKEVAEFVGQNAELLTESGLSDEQIGHDFWLTRNGHGAGFWDRGLGEIGNQLTAACKVYGGVDLYVGDDGLIYQ